MKTEEERIKELYERLIDLTGRVYSMEREVGRCNLEIIKLVKEFDSIVKSRKEEK